MHKDEPLAITATDLALLIQRDPSHVSRHAPVLPRPIRVPTGGRPAYAWPALDLLDWAAARTSHISDEVCRLRVALDLEDDR